MAKEIELWEGYKVTFNEKLLDDFDFITDLSKAQHDDDLPTVISMYFATLGGDKVFHDVREHIVKEKGYFSNEELGKLMHKINDFFPTAGKPASKPSWKTTE